MTTHCPGLQLDNYFPVTIRTKRFIKPYLEALYGNPVIFSSNNLFGTIIAGLLERPNKTHESKSILQFRVFDKLDTEFTIYLPNIWKKKYRFGLRPSGNNHYTPSDAGMLALTKFFENQFEEDLYKFCEMARIYKQETKAAIEDFCRRHNISIEEDITYDCLKQKEHRFSKAQKNLKNSPPELSLKNYLLRKII